MSETNRTPGGDHIEELLSQLKGIFGHLTETEQEEARQKITPPATGPLPTPPKESPAPSEAAPDPFEGVPASADYPPPALGDLTPPEGIDSLPSPDSFIPQEPVVPEGASLLPAAIFYPAGRLQEAKTVADKVGRITPKFTKVAVVLNVQVVATYDPKSDLKTTLLPQIKNSPIKTVFLLVEKPMEESRRRALLSELEPRGIYFQEIPFHQIEKKALYTDMLLGMVFFFDSQKPGENESPAA